MSSRLLADQRPLGAIGVGAAKAAKDVIVAKIQADAQVKIAKIQANAPNGGGQSQGTAD